MADELSAGLETEIEDLLTDLKNDIKAVVANAATSSPAVPPAAPGVNISGGHTGGGAGEAVNEPQKPGFFSRMLGQNPSWRPNNMPPLWRRGLRGIGRSLYYGQSPDNPDYQMYKNMLNKQEHVTLREYVEATKTLDEHIDGALLFHIAEDIWGQKVPNVQAPSAAMVGTIDSQIDSLINKYRTRAKVLFRKHMPSAATAPQQPQSQPQPEPTATTTTTTPDVAPAPIAPKIKRKKRSPSTPMGTAPVDAPTNAASTIASSADAAADAFTS